MSSIRGSDTAETDKPVVGVIKLKVHATDAPEILAEAIDVLAGESRDLPGFLAAEILVSVDDKTIVILTEWSDHHAWSQSRYDARVGKMIEHCYLKSTMLEFELYTRRAKFSRTNIV
jgi:quinol monooxygenase YgiN